MDSAVRRGVTRVSGPLKMLFWYQDDDGDVRGPVDVQALLQMLESCEVNGMTQVREDTSAGEAHDDAERSWSALADVDEIRRQLDAARKEREVDENPPKAHTTENTYESDEHFEAGNLSHTDPKTSRYDRDATSSGTAAVRPEAVQRGDPLAPGPDRKAAELRDEARAAKKRKRAIAKGRERAQRSVYVTNVPKDADEKEVANFFQRCGVLMPDPRTGRPSVALYEDEDGTRKGDARVTYAMEASVSNAILLLDGVPLRDGGEALNVARATFDESKVRARAEETGESAASAKRPRTTQPPRLKGAGHVAVREALGWSEETPRKSRSVRMVVLKNLFDASSAAIAYDDIRADLRDGCAECGEVEKITVFEGSEEGAAVIKFVDGNAARKCVEIMHNRWYNKRRLVAEFYDGETDYRVKESEEAQGRRESQWRKWLDESNDGEG